MRKRRWFVALVAVPAAALTIDGCSNILGIDGEYGDLAPGRDSSVEPPHDAQSDTRDAANDITVSDRVDSGGGNDGTIDVVADVVSDVRVPCETPTGACVAALPANWELVLFASNRATGCPVNFGATEVIAAPSAGAGACDCSCTVNSGATCTQGMMATKYGDDDTCPTVGLTLNVQNGNCLGITSNIRGWYSSTPLPPTIACTAATVTNDSNVNSTGMRQCAVPETCREEICNGEVPAGFSACITRTGDVACPSGWDAKTVVGTGADLTCSSCTCQATANCTNGRITFYSNTGCGTQLAAFDVNDVCQSTGGGGAIRSFRYSATVSNARCTADGMKTGTVALSGSRTGCCK
jgi:hypothetical protein